MTCRAAACQRCAMWRAIIASAILWPLYVIVVFLPLAIVGLVILAPLAALDTIASALGWDMLHQRYRPSHVWPSRYVWAWPGSWLTWVWGNEEDGVNGPRWWQEKAARWSYWRQTYVWSALRNPVNNLRFVPLLNPVIDPRRVDYYTFRRWTFVWQGVYAGLIGFPEINGRTFRFWLGWKLKQDDVLGVPDTDMRKPRCGFAIQFKRIA